MNETSNLELWCRILEVEKTATPEDIKHAYREMVKVWHPDRFANDTQLQQKAQEKLKQINWAYESLQDFLRSGGNTQAHGTAPGPQPAEDPQVERDEFYRRGSSLFFGNGVPKNLMEAAQWLRKSAEMGSDKAQAMLGYMHYKGEGVRKDAQEAARWLRMATEKNYAWAYYLLGCMHEEGFGSNILQKALRAGIDWQFGDPKVEAYRCYNLAVTYGQPEGLERMESVKVCMVQSQINEARSRAAKRYPSYPDKPAREIIHEWLTAYVQELAKNPKRIEWCAQVVSALKRFQGLEGEIVETAFKSLQDKFFANRTNKALNYFKIVGAAWKRKPAATATREDNSRLIAYMLVEEGYGLSPHYICLRETYINQLWLKIYAGR